MKTVYIVMDEPRADSAGDIYESCPTFNKAEALQHAAYAWSHLTPREQKNRRVCVAVYALDIPDDDPRSPAQLYDDLTMDGAWPGDYDAINLPAD